MKRIRNLFVLLLLAGLMCPGTADAQLLKRAKERAKKRIEQKVEKKADDAVDTAVDEAADGVEDAARSAVERKLDAASQPVELNLGPNATGPADAPHVRYRSTTSMNLGALGTVARLLGKDVENVSETISISGLRQRTDQGDQSTIMDLEQDRMITIDHKKKQYSVLTFEEMARQMEAAVDKMKEQRETASASASADNSAASSGDPEAEVDFTFDMDMDETGIVESVNGLPSEQVLLTVKTEFEVEAEDDQQEMQSVRGIMYALVDTWTTKEIAGSETMRKFQMAMAQKMGEQVQEAGMGEALGAISQDPRLAASMEKAAEEMEKLDGMTVRSTMHLILAPEGQALDMEAALRPPTGDDPDRAAAMAQMAENMEAGASDAGAVTQQMTLLRVTTQVSDLQIDPIPAEFFDIPDGYSEVEMF